MKKLRFAGFIIALLMIVCMFAPGSAFSAAETLISTQGIAGYPVYAKGQAGNTKVAYGQYAITAAVEDGDIFQLCRLPAGATVIGGSLYAGDLDTGTETLEMDVGWPSNGTEAADVDGLLNSGVLSGDAIDDIKPEVGTAIPFNGKLMSAGKQTFSEETIIQVEVIAVANTWADGTVSVVVYYTMD